MKEYKGHVVVEGTVTAEAIVSKQPFGFFGGVNPTTGDVIDQWHELHGQNLKGKIFVYPEGRGSTVGAAIILEMVRSGCAPAGIINNAIEIITATGGIIAKKFYNFDLPMVDKFDIDITEVIHTGDIVSIGSNGTVSIFEHGTKQ